MSGTSLQVPHELSLSQFSSLFSTSPTSTLNDESLTAEELATGSTHQPTPPAAAHLTSRRLQEHKMQLQRQISAERELLWLNHRINWDLEAAAADNNNRRSRSRRRNRRRGRGHGRRNGWWGKSVERTKRFFWKHWDPEIVPASIWISIGLAIVLGCVCGPIFINHNGVKF